MKRLKRLFAFVLLLVMILSLCACGAPKLTATEIEQALSDCDGTLDIQVSGDKVTSFTYIVEGVNADDLIDKEYSREAVVTVLSGDTSKITVGQLCAAKAISPLLGIAVLLGDSKEEAISALDQVLDVICDGKTAEYGGWAVSAEVDQDSDSITISVVSK